MLSSFQPAKYCSSNDTNSDEDNENSDDSNVSPTEVREIIEDTLSFIEVSKNNIEQFLDAEKTCTPALQESVSEEAVEPISEKVNI